MNINKKDERIFNPVKVQRKGRWKWIVLGFLAFVLVFGTATLFYLSDKLDSFGLGGIMEIFEEDSDNTVLSDTGESSATILFMSVSSSQTAESGKKEIYFLVLANADMKDKTVRFCPLPVKDSYVEAYESGSESGVCDAVAKEYNTEIDRYVSSNENTFALAINYMGGLRYNVPQRVEYRTKDMTLILTPGEQTIKGESLVKYLKYCKENDIARQGDLFCAMLNQYVTEENMENAMTLYKGVLEELGTNSNISYVDTADNLNNIKLIAAKKDKKAQTVSEIKDLF